MNRATSLFLAIAILAAVSTSTSFAAKKKRTPRDTGLATTLHAVVQKGRLLCMVDHAHDGKGVHRNRSTAMRTAKRDWASFTSEEYGTAWGSLSRATGQQKSCTKFDGLWTCYINARPCRVVSPQRKRRKRR